MDARTRRVLTVVVVVLAVATVAGLFALRPGDRDDRPDVNQFGVAADLYDAQVVDVERGPCEGTSLGLEDAPAVDLECAAVTLELLAGPDEGETTTIDMPDSPTSPDLSEGDKVVLAYSPEAGPGFEYQFADRQRKPVLVWLALLFAVAVVVLGRLRGLSALAGLVGSLVLLLAFALPAIIDGRSPLGVAVVAAAAISFLALYLAHGFTAMTTVALLGTLASLGLTAGLAVAFVELAEFSGIATEEAGFLSAAAASIDLRGLLLAGVVIGALGAIDDMTVTQSAAIAELHAANPEMGRGRLFAAGLRIGRDHVASTVNTLVLAYAGATMPLLVLFVLGEQSLGSVANSEVVAVEIVRTLVGSIGLVASVPITTWLAAAVIRRGPEPLPKVGSESSLTDPPAPTFG